MKLEIKNTGTKQFPFYQIMDGNNEFCATNNFENAERIVKSLATFDDEIDAELFRRNIVQYKDEEDDESHWDEGKLHWARKMFREGAKWANES